MIRKAQLMLLACSSLAAVASLAAAQPRAVFASALADPIRPPEDVARDSKRKPGLMLSLAGIHPGQKIAELAPGGGYFTRILTGVAGNEGHVFAITTRANPTLDTLERQRRNLTVLVSPPGKIPVPEKVDVVWTTLNYHDFKNTKFAAGDAAQSYDAEAFRVLKPGGAFFIVDHEAAPGAGATQTSTLHRIEDVVVKREVEAAGFVLEKESDVLRNRTDDHSIKVLDASIRGNTDQFVLKFRKPR